MSKENPPIVLAEKVFNHISKEHKDLRGITLEILESFFETLYYSSMRTEEGQLIQVIVTFYDPATELIVSEDEETSEHWSFTPFEKARPYTERTLSKLAKAADPWSSSIAVYFNEDNELTIYGLIDQTIHSQLFLNHESDVSHDSAGFFQAIIQGIGHISVTAGNQIVQVLKQSSLEKNYHDVLQYGQINDLIKEKAGYFTSSVTSFMNGKFPSIKGNEYNNLVYNVWRDTITRILIQIKKYGHGGAMLITPGIDGLDINYPITYKRLRGAMLRYMRISIRCEIAQKHIASSRQTIEIADYYDFTNLAHKKKQIENELKGAIRFIASQSCVDGIVVLNDDLSTFGFGAVIEKVDPPKKVYLARAARFNNNLDELDSKNLGTRHRSMMTFCAKNPGAIGIVVSQDGDLRMMGQFEDKLVVWENVKTQKYFKTRTI